MQAATLSFVAALSVADTVGQCLPAGAAPVTCKWPNDVHVGGAKISGILLESSTARSQDLDFVVMGIGINIASHPEGLPYATTSLREQGSGADIDDVLSALALSLDRRYSDWREMGFAPIRSAWLGRADMLGRPVRVSLGETEVGGTFEDLDPDGALVLRLADGTRRLITAGEVFRA